MKATFDISLAHHKMYNSLSNMPLKASAKLETIEDFVIDTYDTTVPMSTYLVAYGISDFEYKEATVNMKDDVKFRIYARRDAMDQVDYAAEVGPKVLKFYEVNYWLWKYLRISLIRGFLSFQDYFQIKFPMPKIDMIGEWRWLPTVYKW